MALSDCIVRLEGVNKRYKTGKLEVPVLHNISFSVKAGEFVVITGASGSGKSTLLNILGCLDLPDSGQYWLDNAFVQSLGSSRAAHMRNRSIGFVFQSFNLFSHMTVFENVALPMLYSDLTSKERKARVEYLLKKVGLWERRKHRPNEISGGQKQRTAIARALANSPRLILADEPTGNLDSTTTHEVMELFQSLNQDGHTMIVITHEADVAAYGGTRYHLADGVLKSASYS